MLVLNEELLTAQAALSVFLSLPLSFIYIFKRYIITYQNWCPHWMTKSISWWKDYTYLFSDFFPFWAVSVAGGKTKCPSCCFPSKTLSLSHNALFSRDPLRFTVAYTNTVVFYRDFNTYYCEQQNPLLCTVAYTNVLVWYGDFNAYYIFNISLIFIWIVYCIQVHYFWHI